MSEGARGDGAAASADHSEDPRLARTGDGGYPEDNPAGERDQHPHEQRPAGSDDRDGDPGQATGNPGAAGASWEHDE